MDILKSEMINWILALKDESLTLATWEWMKAHLPKEKQLVIEKTTPLENTSAVYWLEQLAQIDAFNSIEDPVEWQRNIRQDRELPYR